MNKIHNIIKKSLYFTLSLILLFILISRLFISVEGSVFEENIRLIRIYYYFNYISLFIVLGLLLFKLKLSKKTLSIVIFVYPLIVSLLSLFIFKYPLSSDSMYCWDIASNYTLLKNSGSLLIAIEDYLTIYPFQYGIISVFRLFCFVFGNTLGQTVFQIVQILLASLSNMFLFRLAYDFVDDRKYNDVWYLILTIFWVVPWIISPYIYGLSIGLSIAIISLCLFIKYIRSHENKYLIGSLILFVVAVYLKKNYTILGLSYLIYVIFIYRDVIKKKIIISLCCVCALILSSGIINISAKLIDNIDMPKGAPLLSWFVMSNPIDQEEIRNIFNPKPTVGYYTGYNYSLVKEADYDTDKMKVIMDEDLKKSINYIINNPLRSLNYYTLKVIDTWNSNDFLARIYMVGEGLADSNNPVTVDLDSGVSGFIIKEFTNVGALLLLLGSVVYIIKYRNSNNSEFAIILIWFIGGFLYHLLFETKAVYVYPYMTILMPIAAVGMSELQEKFSEFTSDKKNKKYVYATIPLVLIVAFIYNTQKFVLPTFESYADVNNEMLVEKNVQLTQNVTLDNDLKVDAIEFEYSGHLNENILKITIADGNSVLETISVNQSELDKSQNWIKKSFDSIRLANNKTYSIKFNVVGDGYSDFTIIYGPTAWDNDSVIINGEEYQNSTINFKLLTKEYSRWYYYQNNKVQYVSDVYYN